LFHDVNVSDGDVLVKLAIRIRPNSRTLLREYKINSNINSPDFPALQGLAAFPRFAYFSFTIPPASKKVIRLKWGVPSPFRFPKLINIDLQNIYDCIINDFQNDIRININLVEIRIVR